MACWSSCCEGDVALSVFCTPRAIRNGADRGGPSPRSLGYPSISKTPSPAPSTIDALGPESSIPLSFLARLIFCRRTWSIKAMNKTRSAQMMMIVKAIGSVMGIDPMRAPRSTVLRAGVGADISTGNGYHRPHCLNPVMSSMQPNERRYEERLHSLSRTGKFATLNTADKIVGRRFIIVEEYFYCHDVSLMGRQPSYTSILT